MLVCPACKNVQREGAGVCLVCEARFDPGTDDVVEPRKVVRPTGSPRRAVVLIVAAFLVLTVYLVQPHIAPSADAGQVAMDELVQSVASNLNAEGTISPDVQSRFEQAAIAKSDCPIVEIFLIPSSALPAPTSGQQAAAPEAIVATYVESFRPDLVAVVPALGGTVYVAAGAWGCP